MILMENINRKFPIYEFRKKKNFNNTTSVKEKVINYKKILNKKVAIVTGGSGNIGRAIIDEFVNEGANIVFTYFRNKNKAEDIISKHPKANLVALKCDIRKTDDIKNVVDLTVKRFGRIDILVNNAGGGWQGPIEETAENGWDALIETDLKGAFYFCKFVVPIMKKQHYGKIINMSSIVGTSGLIGHSIHGAAKAGIIGLTKNLAIEVAPFNIMVNAVAPGTIQTDAFPKEFYKRWAENDIPLRRAGIPKDISKFIVFLASSDSDFITGQTIIIDGGQSLIVTYS
jgi:3-oxoacyl-[acyl-carrier protein] reductase